MNYAFVPGGDLAANPKRPDPAAEAHRTLFSRKAFTQLISRPNLTTVKHFVVELAKLPPGSVNDIYVACHGTTLGSLMIPLLPGGPGETQYDDVQDTISSDPSRSIAIPSAILAGPTNAVHLRSCSIGKLPKFLQKLKEALGGQVAVTAPKFIHFITDQVSVHTSVEYLFYDFNITLPALPPVPGQTDTRPVTDRATIVQAFKKHQTEFKLIDGTQVPQSTWDDKDVIPAAIASVRRQISRIALKTPIGRLRSLPAYWDFTVVLNKAPVCTIPFNDLQSIPADLTARMTRVRAALAADPRFADTHPFPVWERQGFASRDAYIDAFCWVFEVQRPTGQSRFFNLVGVGTRYIYSVQFPITENPPAKPLWGGQLIMNAYPASDPSNPVLVPVNDLQTSNSTFFATV